MTRGLHRSLLDMIEIEYPQSKGLLAIDIKNYTEKERACALEECQSFKRKQLNCARRCAVYLSPVWVDY